MQAKKSTAQALKISLKVPVTWKTFCLIFLGKKNSEGSYAKEDSTKKNSDVFSTFCASAAERFSTLMYVNGAEINIHLGMFVKNVFT